MLPTGMRRCRYSGSRNRAYRSARPSTGSVDSQEHRERSEGEDGLLRLGLDGWAFPPATVFNVEASRQIGGFIGIDGVASDHIFALKWHTPMGWPFSQKL